MDYFGGILCAWSIGFVSSMPLIILVSIFRGAFSFAGIGAEIRGA